MEGWIKLHRKIEDNPLYFSEPFTKIMAWIDLLILTNHTGNFFYCRGIRIEVKSGHVGRGIETLASRWKWSRGKVERFLKELEKDNQIVRQKNNVTTLISIANWGEYQESSKANDKTNRLQTVKQTVKQTDTIKNVKNVKNDKEVYNGTDISFSNFWKQYDKFVDEDICEHKWSNMSKKKRKLAIDYIPAYKLAKPDKVWRRDPHRYLTRKVWQNELIKEETQMDRNKKIVDKYKDAENVENSLIKI